jgi:hypothetical protein
MGSHRTDSTFAHPPSPRGRWRFALRVAVLAAVGCLAVVLLASCREETTAPGATGTKTGPATSVTVTVSATPPAAATGIAPSTQSVSSTNGAAISKDEAARIVTTQYGGDVVGVESDSHDGKPTWEVEVSNSNEGRIEVDVDQSSGKIVEVKRED